MIWLTGNIKDAPRVLLPYIWRDADTLHSPDTGEIKLALPVLHLYLAVRERLGAPIRITSGFRTHSHQQWLTANGFKTSQGESPHEKGLALDIDTASAANLGELHRLLQWVPSSIGLPQPRIGYETYGRRFIHFDYVFMLYGAWPGAEYPTDANPRPADWVEGAQW